MFDLLKVKLHFNAYKHILTNDEFIEAVTLVTSHFELSSLCFVGGFDLFFKVMNVVTEKYMEKLVLDKRKRLFNVVKYENVSVVGVERVVSYIHQRHSRFFSSVFPTMSEIQVLNVFCLNLFFIE